MRADRYKESDRHGRSAEQKETNKGKHIVRAAVPVALLLIVVVAGIIVLPEYRAVDTSYDSSVITAVGDPDTPAPDIKSKAAAMYSLDLDRMIYEKNATEHIQPYSITKILTCYLVLENLEPGQMVTASENACKFLEEGMLMELVPGEKVSALDLVYAAMMMSANDGATALAEAVSGDVASFADLMNKTAAEWGCTDTHFVNANGWYDEDHYTTARDMAIITRKCLENDTLREISMTKYYTVPATNKGEELFMENALLKTMDDLDILTGGKTGSWSDDQCSIALEFTEDGLSAVIVLLDDNKTDRPKDVLKLAEYSHKAVPGFRVSSKGEAVCRAKVRYGKSHSVKLEASADTFAYPADEKKGSITVKTKVSELKAPVKKGDKAGAYKVYCNDMLVGGGDLIVSKDVDESFTGRMLKKMGM